ncbi:MAG TPA: cytidylate kinase family protein [Bryobacteraceae bacterium]|jgi:cytidylate kinase|nr:cytidylate kinase family protein [Bryobacteraceae bacterium]
MAIVTVSGETGCRTESLARLVAHRLNFELITEARLDQLIADEFGSGASLEGKAWRPAATLVLARLATEHHLVVCGSGAELPLPSLPGLLRVRLMAREAFRTSNLMVESGSDRTQARAELRALDAARRQLRNERLGRAKTAASHVDLILNAESLTEDAMVGILEAAASSRELVESGFLSYAANAQIEFQMRLQLARHGIAPAGRAALKRARFNHASEQLFANVLDFYRIEWQYEPRSFALQWDKDGRVTEAFTPDFYLPEFDLYIELTTMKQALVTKKNRKVKRLKAIYPHINIQVFYQKDLQDLVFKYGLSDRAPAL